MGFFTRYLSFDKKPDVWGCTQARRKIVRNIYRLQEFTKLSGGSCIVI